MKTVHAPYLPGARHRSASQVLAWSFAVGLMPIAALPVTAWSESKGQPGRATVPAEILDRVEVVGSRIRRVDLETGQPILVIERPQIERSGQMSLGEFLQDLTIHGGALNTTVNNGGDGSTRVDLRNLGEQRTLVLVDGRRWIAGIDGAVDLNSIPMAIVERIEVLKDGASAVYGSDAIGGVVSISTRRDFTGVEARAFLGEYAQGDGRISALEATLGQTWDGAGLTVSLSRTRQEPVFAGDRDISEVPVFGLPGNDVYAGASAATPNGLFGFGSRGFCPFDPSSNYPANGLCNAADGRPPALNRTIFDITTGTYRLFDPTRDGYNFAPENYLLTPQDRRALFVHGWKDLGEATRLSLQVLQNQRDSSQQLAPSPVMLGAQFPGASRLTIPADHVYNPFGQPVTALLLRPGGQVRRFEQDVDTLRLAGGLEGVIEIAEQYWSWELDAVFGRQRIEQDTAGLLDLARLRQALGPTFRDANGTPRCGTPAAPIEGCVPFDGFRGPAGFTPEMLDWAYFRSLDHVETDSRLLSVTVNGEVLELPAGALSMAAGLEFRAEKGESRQDPRRVAIQNLANNSFGGEQRVREAFVEFSAPLLADRAWVERLELGAAVRHSDYDTFGGTSNADFNLRWQVGPDWLLRAGYSQGFRAPIVTELYFPAREIIGGLIDDPCSSANNPNATQRANCLSDGVPGGVYTPVGAFYAVTTGGNPELKPERSRSRGMGLIWSPSTWPGFDAALDWYRIRIDDAISRVDGRNLLLICADQGVSAACARTLRDASGELLAVDSRQLNSGLLEVEGWDLSLRWQRETAFGRFGVGWDSTYTTRYDFELPRGAGVRSGVGVLNPLEPGFRVRSNLDLSWTRGAWSLGAILRYYSGLDEACLNANRPGYTALCSDPDQPSPLAPGSPTNRLPSRSYVDLQAGWETPWEGRVLIGVHNATDRDPPVSYSAFANSFDPAYPMPGRFWYLQWVQRFR
jgi:iron complex outermembrane receptor protein